jgi:hypothetical protein
MVLCVHSRPHLPGAHWSLSVLQPQCPEFASCDATLWALDLRDPVGTRARSQTQKRWVRLMPPIIALNIGCPPAIVLMSAVQSCHEHTKLAPKTLVCGTYFVLFSDAWLFSNTLILGELLSILPLNSCVIADQSLLIPSGYLICQARMGKKYSCRNKCSPGLVSKATKKG